MFECGASPCFLHGRVHLIGALAWRFAPVTQDVRKAPAKKRSQTSSTPAPPQRYKRHHGQLTGRSHADGGTSPPPPPSLMGGDENDDNVVDAYGVPLGENPAGFVTRPSSKVPNRRLPGVGGTDESADTESKTNKTTSSSALFKQCFGGTPDTATVSSYQKQNAFIMPNSRRASSESYGAMNQRERCRPKKITEKQDIHESTAQSKRPAGGQLSRGAGTALPELILRMRIINLILCTLALGLEIPFWIGRVVMLNLSELVLGVCLCGFALLLCSWEMHVPVLGEAIRENFGIVYHPFGRSAFFVMMGGLCIGQGGLELYLGAVILLNAIYTIYFPCRYPHYYKAYEECGEEDMRELAARAKARRQGHAWADQRIVQEEKQNLISKYSSASGE